MLVEPVSMNTPTRCPLEAILATRLAEARAAWPGLDLPAEVFARHVLDRLPKDAGAAAALASLHVADLYLACACARGDARALAAFERRFIAGVPAILARTAWASAADEVQQALRERLFLGVTGGRPKIEEYAGRGPLGGWLRVTALRTAMNLHRRRDPAEALDLDDAAAPPQLAAADPELAVIRARAGAAFNQALRDAFAALSPRERSLLRMQFVDGLGVDRLGLVYQVHRATAARWVAAARDRLLAETRRLAGERLRLGPRELESLLGAVRSELHLSLSALATQDRGAGEA